MIRWLLPFIGHMGICDSEGKVHDFAGPYHIGVRARITLHTSHCTPMHPLWPLTYTVPLFGLLRLQLDNFMVPVTRFMPIDMDLLASTSTSTSPSSLAHRWDASIDTADAHFSQQMHNICCNNCHHHTAMALQEMGLGSGYGTQVALACKMLLYGRWKSTSAMLCTLAPFLVVATIVVLATVLTR